MKVKIKKCSFHAFWYEPISKIKEEKPEDVESKTFEVEPYDELRYRTTADVAGPGVKGFIHIEDAEILG